MSAVPSDLQPAVKLDLAPAYNNPIAIDVWKDKYRYVREDGTSDETTPEDSLERVVRGVYSVDPSPTALAEALDAVLNRQFIPAGRIQAGAGTEKAVTLINCYVNEDIDDSMVGIMSGLNTAALTMQQGGGVGTDFSTIRPKGAIVRATGSVSSGILPFMRMWNSMCGTIMSSGSRRGAMMGTLADWHPDVLDFIEAKTKAGELTNFNVSVLVSDAFMAAVEADADWNLGFGVPPATHVAGDECLSLDHHPAFAQTDEQQAIGRRMANMREKDGQRFYIHKTLKARELWDKITALTYDYAEPGTLFVSRINSLNNLQYCEYIHCTNPCGEQPLPPHNVCDLGSVNLALIVDRPFQDGVTIDFDRLRHLARVAVRFLDNVLDATRYPLQVQREEALSKRRIGVGITGLGNMLQMLGLRYGSPDALAVTHKVMAELTLACYHASADLAIERGAFPLCDNDAIGNAPFVQRVGTYELKTRGTTDLLEKIGQTGLRNGVILSIAPTGTISLGAGNIASGLEPTFSFKPMKRKVLQPDGSHKEYLVKDFGYFIYEQVHGETPYEDLPDYMRGAMELSVDEHLAMQAVCQEWTDSSISKTINCPADMSYEDFKEVYSKAYKLGLKGCTTYRPSGVRGSVLSEVATPSPTPAPAITQIAAANDVILLERPEVVEGRTYKLKWQTGNVYLTVNSITDEYGNHKPIEVFITAKSAEHQEWVSALTRTISAVFRRGGDVTFLVDELMEVTSASGGGWVPGGFSPSLVAYIGKTLKTEFKRLGLYEKPSTTPIAVRTGSPEQVGIIAQEIDQLPDAIVVSETRGEQCPSCKEYTLIRSEGCKKCTSCSYSACG